ncbi:MAG TPA: ribosome maturation factor RimM [Nitrolancea sp.]|jgi:16S rRNA processing protein RimM|nr:ribosome maturation factor RimM [Nitrolancea sp.]
MVDNDSSQPERLAIGVIVAPHGTRGEVRMQIWTHFPEHLVDLRSVYLGDEERPRRLRHVGASRGHATLSIQGVSDRSAAEELRGTVVRIAREQAVPLDEDEFYHFELIGLKVETEAGEPLGTVTEIIETGANDVYVVKDAEGNEVLIPALKEVVPVIDLDAGKMIVRPLTYWG